MCRRRRSAAVRRTRTCFPACNIGTHSTPTPTCAPCTAWASPGQISATCPRLSSSRTVGGRSAWAIRPSGRRARTTSTCCLPGYTQLQATNGPSAHVGGVEATLQQHLSFLPGPASGLGFMVNYSHTTSKASVPGRTDDPALLRQAPNNWNLDVTYDRRALSARLGVTHNDANIFAYNYQPGADGGINGPNGDLYLYAHTQVDAQASYAVSRRMQFVVALLNLNNEVFGFYQGSPQYPIQREFYNRTISVGIRLTR